MVGLLGEKFTFFNSFGTTKIFKSLRLSVYINVFLLINFPEQFEYSASNIREVIKFHNLGDKTFETDFNFETNSLTNLPVFHRYLFSRICL